MKEELMLYLHVPFCVRKCNYCDFLSAPCGEETKALYVEQLCREVRERGKEYSGRIVTSIFFGGGTPSLLSPAQISMIMNEIRVTFAISKDAEITMECNPGTVSAGAGRDSRSEEGGGNQSDEEKERLLEYRRAGINRLSIGLQTMNDAELLLLGRIHDRQAFLNTYRLAREAGFSNVSVDLMSALPGQTLESWKETLGSVLSLKPVPEHISVYSLIMEEGTAFYDWDRQGRFQGELSLPSEDADREIYAYTGKRLKEAGISQYEISNYAREGFYSRHNYGYWTRKDYLGLGLGAASLLGDKRCVNEKDLTKYLADPLAGREEQLLSRKDQMEEFMFLGLRTIRGVKRADFYECFGESMDDLWREVIQKNVADGLLSDDGEGICLTAKGLDLDNYVSACFLLDD